LYHRQAGGHHRAVSRDELLSEERGVWIRAPYDEALRPSRLPIERRIVMVSADRKDELVA
jgi:hypothetical protein